MKTLFISDLDGTLLGPDAQLSEYAEASLSRMVEEGLHFTVATARTYETTGKILRGIGLRTPLVLMNGVLLYDPAAKRYVNVKTIPEESVLHVIRAMHRQKVNGFMYRLQDEKLHTYYEALDTPWLIGFYEERRKKYDKHFVHTDNLETAADQDIVYFSVFNTKEKLDPIYEAIRDDPYIKTEYYADVYSETLWYLEIGPAGTSKAEAIRFLRRYGGYERIVSFGDNYNDLSMFSVSDESIAVSNARDEVRKRADLVIGSNTEDGVVRYLERRMKDGTV